MSPSFRSSSASDRDALPAPVARAGGLDRQRNLAFLELVVLARAGDLGVAQHQRAQAEVVGRPRVEGDARVASRVDEVAPGRGETHRRQRIRRDDNRDHAAGAVAGGHRQIAGPASPAADRRIARRRRARASASRPSCSTLTLAADASIERTSDAAFDRLKLLRIDDGRRLEPGVGRRLNRDAQLQTRTGGRAGRRRRSRQDARAGRRRRRRATDARSRRPPRRSRPAAPRVRAARPETRDAGPAVVRWRRHRRTPAHGPPASRRAPRAPARRR